MSRAPTPAAASAPLLMLPLVLLVLVCGVPASVVIPSVQPVVARSSFGGGHSSVPTHTHSSLTWSYQLHSSALAVRPQKKPLGTDAAFAGYGTANKTPYL